MSGLVLKLSPKERLLVNGAVIENGERRSRLSILTPKAHILRLRDAIHPERATTPVRRVCYAMQLVLSGDVSAEDSQLSTLRNIEELSRILTDSDSRRHLTLATDAVLDGKYYYGLKALRCLIPREDRLLAAHHS
ncbi:flagellar biosynthesis repressor FlbT [Shimia thalassica]|uniref:Flagellar biosynthesis repressor FlbT n=1 Tax=Shimia thalassica TaxID=1715693 RepID=A0A0P1IPU9_9RHOB|nr:flagellar biosynthesis repressor FlbT [Shimia thalassica]PHO05372.1 flagellar biosynthesis repressor FlbT [Rhodobacteraceae bacterium 4F10]MBU2942357.1 flagellar biosynthesis repressor FlbT [Shimia thalassica]MDO6479771.1 flagellar biosynthesis repressor FlbT [Shimia thalassica]MDO6485461.1 flagellar biosynthesis repressor FlbT [Shimia thalassica]MDO6504285.1 flagellar biosynthesis repressor FlbT [Shimia thalassica]